MTNNDLYGDLNLKKNKSHHAIRGHAKKLVNLVMVRLGREPTFTLSTIERIASAGVLGTTNKYVLKLKKTYRFAFLDTLIGPSFIVLMICLAFAIIWGGVSSFPEHGDLLVEFWGLIFDVCVILVGFGFIQYWKQKRDDIARQHELIEDFKDWNSKEARYRILGALRRLNRSGQTEVNLSGTVFKDVSFRKNGITSLRGSLLSGGGWGFEGYRTSQFTKVDFSGVDCRNVIFEKGTVLNNILIGPSAQYLDCSFWEADLQNAIFDGATLKWSSPPPSEMGELVDEDQAGNPIFSRTVADCFNDADLALTSFKKCTFKNADFRLAVNIEKADFTGSKGLETCIFDNEEIKNQVLTQCLGG
jgi:uncharacterized protein YjbI with pentapeptide repeats